MEETAEIFDLKEEIIRDEPDSEEIREKINQPAWKYTSSLKNFDMANLFQLVVRRAAIVEILALACGKNLAMQAQTASAARTSGSYTASSSRWDRPLGRRAGAHSSGGANDAECIRDRAYIARKSLEAVNRLLAQMGAMGLAETNPVQRRFRDLRALANTRGLDWDPADARFRPPRVGARRGLVGLALRNLPALAVGSQQEREGLALFDVAME